MFLETLHRPSIYIIVRIFLINDEEADITFPVYRKKDIITISNIFNKNK